MSFLNTPTPDTSLTKTAYLTFNLSQNAGTYDLGVVSGGDIAISQIIPYNSVAGAGFTTAAIATNDTTPTVIAAATAAAVLTGGLSMTPITVPIVLPSGKKIQGTIVGTGSGGTIKVAVIYHPLANGAVLA